jgi:hypothetical protein
VIATTRSRVLIFVAAVVLLVGCGNDTLTEAPDKASSPGATAQSAPSEQPVRPLPPRGEAKLLYANGLVTIDAFAAPRLPLLERLANDASFDLVTEASELPPLTLRVDAAPLELALPLLVGDLAYSAEWSTSHGQHRLVKLTVGAHELRTVDATSDGSLPEGEVSATLERAIAALGAEPLSETETKATAARFADPDPEQRVQAALVLEPEGEQLKTLCDLLAHDPDPRVRAAATTSLENSEDFAAVRALVDALRDPNPEVVIEAIDSLEFAADESVTRDLEPLLAHDDARVRQRAADAIEYFGR